MLIAIGTVVVVFHVTVKQLRTVIDEQLIPNLPAEATEESDAFRDETLYTWACDNVFQAS